MVHLPALRVLLVLVALTGVPACSSDDSCVDLRRCCEALMTLLQPKNCLETAAAGDSQQCKANLDQVKAAGLCIEGADGGLAGDGPSSNVEDASRLTQDCKDLRLCCELLDGDDRVSCYGVLAPNDPFACQQTRARHVESGMCPEDLRG